MDKETFHKKITELGTIEDETQRREILAEISEEVDKVYDERETITAEVEQLREDNENVRKANMKLFTRIGANKTEEERTEDQTGIKEEEKPEPRKFEDLFNEKGELK